MLTKHGDTEAPLKAATTVLRESRLHMFELLPWVLAIVVYFFFEQYLSLGAAILVMILFAMSLDLLVGYAGVVSLGHGLFFGVGAYTAGVIALSGWSEPLSSLVVAGLVSGALGAGLCLIGLSRLRGLLFIMTTLALVLIAHELAKGAKSITGGDDGMQGIEVAPLFGMFRWSVYGHTAYLYALGLVFVFYVALRMVVASPFGLALRGLRENYGRMQLVGAPVHLHFMRAFALSGFVAGCAGALSAQTTGFVDLSVLSLDVSAGVLVMLVLGGLGRLHGAFVGVTVYMVVQNVSAKIDPYYWMFVVGTLLVFVVLFSRGGLLALAETAWLRLTRGRT